MNVYKHPTEVVEIDRLGSIKNLDVIKNAKRILIVTGNQSLDKSGLYNTLLKSLKDKRVERFKVVEQDPYPEIADECAKTINKFKVQIVLAIGGGSVLDTAKAGALLSKNKGKCLDYLDGNRSIKFSGVTVVAVPTTTGSGSEVTPFSVFSSGNTKKTLEHEYNYPAFAVLVPEPLKSLPKDKLSTSTVDAIAQSIEAYWAKNENFVSDALAVQALRMIFNNAKSAYKGNLNKRFELLKASCIAGLSFAKTRTTACHAMSYPMTMKFGVPHGCACAITVIPVLKRNYKVKRAKLNNLFIQLGFKDMKQFINSLSKLFRELNVEVRLNKYGIKKNDLDFIVNNAFSLRRLRNNPVVFTKNDIKKIMLEIY